MIEKEIVILGGGLSGLVIARRLAKEGHKVHVLEKEKVLGGLAGSFEVNNKSIPLCYHQILEKDTSTKGLVKELNLDYYDKSIKMGFLYGNKIYEITPLKLLFFKPLPFIDRIRFGLFGLRILLTKSLDNLHEVNAVNWIKKYAGSNVFNIIFKPLLKTKFDRDWNKISASWIAIRLKERESSGKFGYLHGGLSKLFDALEKEIVANGGIIEKNIKVKKVSNNNSDVKEVIYKVEGKEKKIETDLVISTIPIPELLKITSFPDDYSKKLQKIRYNASISVVMELENKLTDYYWLNFLDKGFKLGGIFDHAILNPDAGNSVIWLFTYINPDDEFYKSSDEKIVNQYISEIKTIFPEFEKNIKWWKLFRLRYSKPIYEVGYSQYKPEYRSPIKGLYLGGTSLFYPRFRYMKTAIDSGNEIADLVLSDLNLKNEK